MKKSKFYESVVATKKIEFEDENGNKIPDEVLNVTYAKVKRPYKQTKAWLAMSRESQELIKAQGDVKKRLAVRQGDLSSAEGDEEKANIQKQVETLNAELQSINGQVKDYIEPFANFLIPSDDSPRKVLLNWDLLDENDEAIPATREELEDLPDEVIVFIAGQLLSEGETGEERPAK